MRPYANTDRVAPRDSHQCIFVSRFFYPDHSATSQILSGLASHLARGTRISVITSRGLYDDPKADLPPFEMKGDVVIHRVYKPRFGRGSLAGRAIDYLAMYQCCAAAAWRPKPGDFLIAKTDPPLLPVAPAPVARTNKLALINLPSWCDDELITPLPTKDNPLRSAWGLDDKFVIGYSGNFGRAHEYATLLDTAEFLSDERDIVFLFIGSGHSMQSLRSQVERRGLAESFQFRPYQAAHDLAMSLAISDVHWISLLPAMEGLIVPSKFYGVAAAGRPTIAVTDPYRQIAELVRRYKCGAVVTPGDGHALAQAIRDFKTDRVRLEQMGRNARALLDRSLRKKIALEHWEKLLQRAWDTEANTLAPTN